MNNLEAIMSTNFLVHVKCNMSDDNPHTSYALYEPN